MTEQWKPLPTCPAYLVSDLGRMRGPRGRIMAGYTDRHGYHCVTMQIRGWQKSIKVHRAVVEAFCGPIPLGMQINHKNGLRSDNRLDNLEVVTPAQNVQHGFSVLGRKGRNTRPTKGERHPNSKLTDDAVLEMRRLYSEGATQVQLAAKFGIAQNHVSRIVRREAWSHVGA